MDHLKISLVFWLHLAFILKVHQLDKMSGWIFPTTCSFIWIPLTSKVKHMKFHLNIRKQIFTEWELLNTNTGDPGRLSAFPGVSQSLAGHNPGQCVQSGLDNVEMLFPNFTVLWFILWGAQHLKAAEAGHRVPRRWGKRSFSYVSVAFPGT